MFIWFDWLRDRFVDAKEPSKKQELETEDASTKHNFKLVVIGGGVFSGSLLFVVRIALGSMYELSGFPTVADIYTDAESMSTATLTVLAMTGMSVLGTIVGFFILVASGIIFGYSKLKPNWTYFILKKKPVSITWQVVLSFIPGFHLLPFYKIEKLRLGVLLEVITHIFNFAIMANVIDEILYPSSSVYGVILMSFLYLFFIIKWSRDWNKKYRSNQENNFERKSFVKN